MQALPRVTGRICGARASSGRSDRLWAVALTLIAATFSPTLLAQSDSSGGPAIEAIDYSALDADRVLVTVTLSGPPPSPAEFTVENPSRVAFDLPGTTLALSQHFGKIGLGKVISYALAQAKGRSRLVIETNGPVPNKWSIEGNKLLVELDAPGVASLTGSSNSAPTEAKISKIDFHRGERGEGRIIVALNDAHTQVDISREGGNVVARLKHVAISDSQIHRLDVIDFATPVKYVDISRVGADTQIVVTPVNLGTFDQVAYQANGEFVLELQPLTQDKIDQIKRDQPVYTGQRISLSFQSVDVRALLQIIADVAKTNMVVSDSVHGDLAMRLQNVPWDQALDIILRTKGLGMRREGNVMLVAPLEELAQREKIELEAQNQKVQLATLDSDIIQINYAKASEIATLLKSNQNSILTSRGRVSVDERTNTLLILETRDKLAEIRALVQRLDVPIRQVLIESRIVVANNTFDKEYGTQFGITAIGTTNGGPTSVVSGNGSSANGITTALSNGTSPIPISNPYSVSLPVSGAAGTIGLALLGSNFLVDLELSALQAEGHGEIVSSPRVITANAKPATIEQGVEVPYQEAASSGATSVSFKKAVLSLDVTPQITPDERIIMDLTVNDDSVGAIYNGVPSIDTRKVKTQVLVNNGETVVLGGIYENTNNSSVTKVPLLGDVPFLGQLFRNTIRINNKTELLIFITPKILTENLHIKQD